MSLAGNCYKNAANTLFYVAKKKGSTYTTVIARKYGTTVGVTEISYFAELLELTNITQSQKHQILKASWLKIIK
jgi:hypothetical protein